jgi:nucleoside-diphosphate-sugar epimerase
MKILLVGGAGYIGSALAPALLERGYEIDVIDLFWFGNSLPSSVRIIKKDVFACGKADFEGYDQIVLLAGLSNDPMAEFSPAMNFTFNGSLPSYVAYVAKLAGVRRVVYASSCSVYGYTVNELYDEDAPVTCNYPYGISKLQGERGVLQMKDKDFSVIALRKGTVCGYSPRMRFDLIINTMYKCAVLDGRITVNNASLWRPILDIRDAVSAYLRAIQADYSVSGIFNIASDNCTVGHVADRVKAATENLLGKPIAVDIKNIKDLRNYKVSIGRAKTVLGFEPAYRVDDIVKDVHDHRAEYPNLDEDRYYNIRIFKKMTQPA